jgi:hypothetical protein
MHGVYSQRINFIQTGVDALFILGDFEKQDYQRQEQEAT